MSRCVCRGPLHARLSPLYTHSRPRHGCSSFVLYCQSSIAHSRFKSTKTTAKLDDLPQGLLPLEPLPKEDDEPAYPTVLLQARSNMRKFENCVLLTRVGGFYELYFEQADEFAPLLNLKVVQRKIKRGTTVHSVSMAGFPFLQLDRYLKVLVQDLNRYVAIAEEFPNDASAKVKAGGLLHDRRVSRIITPGTLIDENFMDPFSNNYVLAVHIEDTPSSPTYLNTSESHVPPVVIDASSHIGLAWLDLSTGQFSTQLTTISALPSFLTRVGPREIVLDESLQDRRDHGIFSALAEDKYVITYMKPHKCQSVAEWSSMLESPVPAHIANEFTPNEVNAGSMLLHYVHTTLQGSDLRLQSPSRHLDVMNIDRNTMKALEIKKTLIEDVFAGSLLHTIRRTVTKGGARLLERWLSSPSTSPDVINSRLDLVSYMVRDDQLRERIILLLRRCHDSHRLLQKFAFGRGDPDDLIALANTIYATQDLLTMLRAHDFEHGCIRPLLSRITLEGPRILADHIKSAVDEEGVEHQHFLEEGEAQEIQAFAHQVVNLQGSREDTSVLPKGTKKKRPSSIKDYYSDDNEFWIMKPGASSTLQSLHQGLSRLGDAKDKLTQELSGRLGIPSLTLKFTPGLGHICHVKGKDTRKQLAELKSVSSSKSTHSFHHQEWTKLGQEIDQCRVQIRAEEQRVFHDLKEQVIINLVRLRRNATVLDELDIATSLATLADEKGWIRPILTQSNTHKIIGGRHPTVERGLQEEGRSFTSNDCFIGDQQPVWMITGPNMAGKSTFLRQNAIITIMAQLGSLVPADYAEIGIVDQIFSRMGSADNLYRDQSTFMVEMLETAAILREATARSLVIMDEIGRGTTPADGTAVAFACLHHLYHVNKCRTLFATHFHALADIAAAKNMTKIGFYCTDVEEDSRWEGGFRYIHKLQQGINRQSHALKVATLAGLPQEAIGVAKEVLKMSTVQHS
ncbi:MutS2 protein [Xylogone sp. PMI_703]|nr:MutS2 protein [Xylogone sp. PMI_703]